MSAFQAAKLWMVGLLGLPRDALHISAGLAVFLGVATLFRLPLRDWRTIAAVLVMALAVEIWDLADSRAADESLRWDKSWHDVWVTMFWPLLLWALARWTPVLRR